MLTVLLGLGSALSYSLHDFVVLPATRRVGALAVTFWVLLVSSIGLMAVALVWDGVPHGAQEWRAVGIAGIGGVLYVLGVIALLRGFEVGQLSLVSPLAALEGAVAAIIAIALGERLTTLAIVALPLAAAGAVMAAIVRGDEHDATSSRHAADDSAPARSNRRLAAAAGAAWGLLAAVLFAGTLVLYGYADGVAPASAAAWGRLAGMALFVPFALWRVPLAMPASLHVRSWGAGVLEAAGYVLSVAALARGPISVASAVVSQFATIAVVLGVVVYHERPSCHQAVGICCTIVAVVLFALAA